MTPRRSGWAARAVVPGSQGGCGSWRRCTADQCLAPLGRVRSAAPQRRSARPTTPWQGRSTLARRRQYPDVTGRPSQPQRSRVASGTRRWGTATAPGRSRPPSRAPSGGEERCGRSGATRACSDARQGPGKATTTPPLMANPIAITCACRSADEARRVHCTSPIVMRALCMTDGKDRPRPDNAPIRQLRQAIDAVPPGPGRAMPRAMIVVTSFGQADAA